MGEQKEHKKEGRMSDVDSHVADRYEIKKRLGKGAYGIVWKAVDNQTMQVVAVKKIYEAFRNKTDAQRTFREIMFLQAFKGHPNIITLRGLHRATNNKDIYLVFDYMDSDLHNVIKRGTILKDSHKRYITYQLFKATMYLHSGNVIHRDQKPSNVLINTECKIKIADFGLARTLTNHEEDDDAGNLTDYVATRWYRAPEILVASKKYTKGVDIWSLGCILGELLHGKPLFPGSSTVNQMERILAVLPQPTSKEIYEMCSGHGRGLLEGYTGPKTTLKELVQSSCEEAVDLLNRLLIFDPAKRLTCAHALRHPYVSGHFNGEEPTLMGDVTLLLDDDVQLSVADYRNKLYEIIESARAKRRQSLEVSPEVKPGPSERKKVHKSGCTRGKYIESWSKPVSKMNGSGDLKPLDGSLRRPKPLQEDMRDRPKHSIADDVRDRRVVRDLNANKPTNSSDYNVAPTKKPTSPQRRVNGSRVSCWPERQRVLGKPTRNGLDEIVGESCTASRPNAHSHYSDAISQVKEKLRRAQLMTSQLSVLPKVQRRKEPMPSSSSPTIPQRLPRQQGVLSTNSIHDIRRALKHANNN